MFDVFQGLFLEGSTVLQTAIFLAGCAILIVMGLSFEKAFSKVMAGRTVFPIILTILLAQIFFSHTVLSLLVFQSPEQVKLAEGEIITLMIHFHQSHYRNFKAYYLEYVCKHLISDFPHLLS